MDLSIETDISELSKILKQQEKTAIVRAERLAELLAREVIKYARSHTDETKPGVNENDGPRKVHPGGWADVRGQLANSIKMRIEVDGLKVSAVVEAIAEYAEALDAKTGYDVLGGADQIAKQAIRKHAHKFFD